MWTPCNFQNFCCQNEVEHNLQQVLDVEMKLLRIFMAVVECESFKGAESVLGIAQSAISIAMSQLESRLGLKLCDRGRGGFRLTDEGLVVYQAAQRLFGAVDEFKADTGELRGKLQGSLHLGIVNNTITDTMSPIPMALEKFNQFTKNEININITIASCPELQKQVNDGRLHVAIGPFRNRISGLSYTQLYDEEHFLCCGRNHPLFDNQSRATSLGDTSNIRLVARTSLDNRDIKSLGLKCAETTVQTIEAQTLLIRSCMYIGFLPKHFAAKWIKTDELRPLLTEKIQHKLPFYINVRNSKLRTPIVKAFTEFLIASAQEISPPSLPVTRCK